MSIIFEYIDLLFLLWYNKRRYNFWETCKVNREGEWSEINGRESTTESIKKRRND